MNNYEQEEILAEPNEPTLWMSITYGFSLLQAHAWYIIAVVGFLYYIWKQKLAVKYEKWKEDREIARECSEMKKNPELFIHREEGRMNAIQRLQEEYDKQACKMKELEKEKQERLREEFLEKTKSQGGRRLNDDYLPLAGGSSMGYRAPRRSCPGGSCNNK